MEVCIQCSRYVLHGSKHCEKHKARRGLHRVKFVEGVKNRVLNEHGRLICENLTNCPLYGLVEYKENWLDADHIIEVMEFDDSATLKEINDPRTNGRLLCKFCHSDKNIQKRPAKAKDVMGVNKVEEIKVEIEGFGGLYEITESGRIYSNVKKDYKRLYENPYGFKNVHLFKNGKRYLFLTFDLWKKAFPHLPRTDYKGM